MASSVENLSNGRKRLARGIFGIMTAMKEIPATAEGKAYDELEEEDDQFLCDLTNGIADVLLGIRMVVMKGG